MQPLPVKYPCGAWNVATGGVVVRSLTFTPPCRIPKGQLVEGVPSLADVRPIQRAVGLWSGGRSARQESAHARKWQTSLSSDWRSC